MFSTSSHVINEPLLNTKIVIAMDFIYERDLEAEIDRRIFPSVFVIVTGR